MVTILRLSMLAMCLAAAAGQAAAVMWGGDFAAAYEIREALNGIQSGEGLPDPSREMLVTMLSNEDWVLAGFAAYTLGECRDDPEALAALRTAKDRLTQNQADGARRHERANVLPFVRVAVIKLECPNEGQLREALWPLLEEDNELLQSEAARELVRIHAGGIDDVLTKWRETDDGFLRNWSYDLRRRNHDPKHTFTFECSDYGSLTEMIYAPEPYFGSGWCGRLLDTKNAGTSQPTEAEASDGSLPAQVEAGRPAPEGADAPAP